MRLRQAKKIMVWYKGEGNSRSKDYHKCFWRKCYKLRPCYYDEKRGVWVQPSCHNVDIIRRAHTRLFRWIRKGKNETVFYEKDGKPNHEGLFRYSIIGKQD